LKHGGLVAFPTDTVYGVGALAFDAAAVESIYAAKDRPVEKAIPILIGGPEDLDKVTAEIPPIAAKLAARFWPGPLTLVVPKHPPARRGFLHAHGRRARARSPGGAGVAARRRSHGGDIGQHQRGGQPEYMPRK
jgi:L-threonylcarbamoyladenylate synthase